MPGAYIFVPCHETHNPMMPPHGRIVHASQGYHETDCQQGIAIRTLDGAEAFFEVMVMGECLGAHEAEAMLDAIRAHGVPEDIMPEGRDPRLYQALRHVYAQRPREFFRRVFAAS